MKAMFPLIAVLLATGCGRRDGAARDRDGSPAASAAVASSSPTGTPPATSNVAPSASVTATSSATPSPTTSSGLLPPSASGSVAAAVPALGACADAGTLASWRYSPSATLLPDGRVMVAGGRQHDGEQGTTSVEMWEPATRTFKPSSPLAEARTMHRAVLLEDGRVLVAGGRAKLIEIYNPKSDKWRKAGRTRQTTVQTFVVALSDGRAIITGGDMEWKGAFSDEVLVLDPTTSLVTEVGGLEGGLAGGFAIPRPDGTAVLLGWQAQEDFDKPMKRFVLRADTGKTGSFTGADASVEALMRLSSDAADVIGYDMTRASKMIASSTSVSRFDAKAKKWDVVATYGRKHEAGAAAFLDEHHVLVLGGLEKEHATAELCSF